MLTGARGFSRAVDGAALAVRVVRAYDDNEDGALDYAELCSHEIDLGRTPPPEAQYGRVGTKWLQVKGSLKSRTAIRPTRFLDSVGKILIPKGFEGHVTWWLDGLESRLSQKNIK